ncbi:MAG: MBL fold metallo-hydrolase [Candidatus Geothermincolia bacterium]
MRLRWLGTAGFQFHAGGKVLLADPYLTRNERARPHQPLHAEDMDEADVIFLTHGHFDHSYDVPAIAAKTGAMVYCSAGVAANLRLRGMPWRQVEALGAGQKFQVGDVILTPLASRHVVFDMPLMARTLRRSLTHLPSLFQVNGVRFPEGGVFNYLLEVDGKRLLHMGSAHMNEDSQPLGDIDVFFVPVQGRSDIQDLAVRLTERVAPRIVIPHHHDDFYPPLSQMIDLRPFLAGVAERLPETLVIVPELNRWMEL